MICHSVIFILLKIIKERFSLIWMNMDLKENVIHSNNFLCFALFWSSPLSKVLQKFYDNNLTVNFKLFLIVDFKNKAKWDITFKMYCYNLMTRKISLNLYSKVRNGLDVVQFPYVKYHVVIWLAAVNVCVTWILNSVSIIIVLESINWKMWIEQKSSLQWKVCWMLIHWYQNSAVDNLCHFHWISFFSIAFKIV